MIVLGTRPEAIKLAPVIKEIQKTSSLQVMVCVFRQHEEILDQVLQTFGIVPDVDLRVTLSDKAFFGKNLNIVTKGTRLIRSGISLIRFVRILKKEKPDLLVVQGDTSTALLAALIGFHMKVPIAHVEAGLRTHNKYSPFPEEMNRALIGRLADLHYAPTEGAKENLLREGIIEERIVVSGNTAIDALLIIREQQKENKKQFSEKYETEKDKKIILVTAHRRESFGEGLSNIFTAIKEIAQSRNDVIIFYPVHPNPNVSGPAREALGEIQNVHLIEPLEYEEFIWLMNKSYLILTDSGGIQEEAPSLGKPVLVTRNTTEREEGVKAGVARLVGTDTKRIVAEVTMLLENKSEYEKMATVKNPYGDGIAAKKIIEGIQNYLAKPVVMPEQRSK